MSEDKKKESREYLAMGIFVVFVVGPAFLKWQIGEVGFTGFLGIPFWVLLLQTAVAGAVCSFLGFGHRGNKLAAMVLGGVYGARCARVKCYRSS